MERSNRHEQEAAASHNSNSWAGSGDYGHHYDAGNLRSHLCFGRSANFPLLDSNLRFFGGVWLGLGVAILWLVPSIEKQGVLFRAIWGAIFLGGIGRLLSIVFLGLPPIPFIGFTALEIIGAPLFIYWQYRVAQIYVQSFVMPNQPIHRTGFSRR